MKLLKKKIAQAKSLFYFTGRIHQRVCLLPPDFHQEEHPLTYNFMSSVNIFSNYFKAICEFSTSESALPYLKPLLIKENIQYDCFLDFVHEVKYKKIGFVSFISILRPKTNDTDNIIACKKVFKSIAIVFIKYFSLNWIFKRPEGCKTFYLKLRFKLINKLKKLELLTFF